MPLKALHTLRPNLPVIGVKTPNAYGPSPTVKEAIAQASPADSFTAKINGVDLPAKSVTTSDGSRAVVVAASLNARLVSAATPSEKSEKNDRSIALMWFDDSRPWKTGAFDNVLDSATVMVLNAGQVNEAFPKLAGHMGDAPLAHLPELDEAMDKGQLGAAYDNAWTINDRVIYIPRENAQPYPLDELPGSLVEFSYRKSVQMFVGREIYLVRSRQDAEMLLTCEMGFTVYMPERYTRPVILMLPFCSRVPHAAGPHHVLGAGMRALLGVDDKVALLPYAYGFLRSGGDAGGIVIVDIAGGNLYVRNSGVSQLEHPFKNVPSEMTKRAKEMLGAELGLNVSLVGVKDYTSAQEAKMSMPRYGMR